MKILSQQRAQHSLQMTSCLLYRIFEVRVGILQHRPFHWILANGNRLFQPCCQQMGGDTAAVQQFSHKRVKYPSMTAYLSKFEIILLNVPNPCTLSMAGISSRKYYSIPWECLGYEHPF